MSVLFVARYNGQYLYFDNKHTMTDATQADNVVEIPGTESFRARQAAMKLFGVKDDETGQITGQESGVVFRFCDSFYQTPFFRNEDGNPNYSALGFGWVAIVPDSSYEAMRRALGYQVGTEPINPEGLLLQRMYDIQIIPLNNDHDSVNIADTLARVYEDMTPRQWH